MSEQTHLNEFDADEWFDIGRAINPAYTREAFDADMKEFIAEKEKRQEERARQ